MLKTVSSITNAIGALNYKGTWNASTNSPALASGVGTKGDYYVVSVAGATNLDGETLWGVGDWAVYNGAAWQRLEGGSTINATTVTANSYNKMAITAPATSSTLAVADGKTLTASNTLTLAGTDSTTMTFPATSATIARTDAAQTFTGVQTLSSQPILSSLTASQAVFTDASKGLVSVYPTAYVGGLTRVANAANSSVSYTGVGFKPSAIYFMTDLATGGTGHGFSNGTAQRATTSESGVSVGTITTGCCYYTAGAGTQTLIGSLTSMDADGFTISWTHVGLGASTIVISYMAFR